MLTISRMPQEIILERLRQQAVVAFSGHALNSLSIESHRDMLLDRMNYVITQELPAEKIEERTKEVFFEYPTNCIEMFKEQYMPNWFLNKFPVRKKTVKKTVKFKKYAAYPKLKHIFPDTGPILFRSYIQEDYAK